MLRDKISAAEKSDANAGLVAPAKKLLDGATGRVLHADGASTLNWSQPKDRSVADSFCVEILEAPAALLK